MYICWNPGVCLCVRTNEFLHGKDTDQPEQDLELKLFSDSDAQQNTDKTWWMPWLISGFAGRLVQSNVDFSHA